MHECPESASTQAEETREARFSRRGLLRTSLASAAGTLLPSAFDLNGARTMAQSRASGPPDAPTTYEGFVERARALAAEPYRPAPEDLPQELAALDYDAYQRITFRPEKTIHLGRRFSLQPFHRGFLQRKRVDVVLQGPDGTARRLDYDSSLFDLGPALQGRSYPRSLGYAGFRLNTGFDAAKPDVQEEFLVFLGASYFRLRGRGQTYGLSARGVAVNTFGPGSEEFPDFTAFRILEPSGDEATITVLALLDGPSLAGAYRFVVTPGETAHIAVTASLHPRREIARLGLAPLTSMFLHGQNGAGARGAEPFDDFRPQVHDSDGLAVETEGDRLWRPLVNGRPSTAISAFEASPLKGFGLLQRNRRFSDYLDVQARHEDRPGLWVRPEAGNGAFASGAVQLFEIPSSEEYTDNIVAAFVPSAKPAPGRAIELAYGLTTVGAEPTPLLGGTPARVVSTRIGSAERLRPTNPPSPQRRLYVIDFEGDGLPSDPRAQVDVALSASAGAFVDPFTERVPQTGGWRLYAEYRPPNPLPAGDVVLRARLSHAGRVITETWDAVA
ncbi:glucan biosynthesis protein [Methylobacterium gnaphalii]|uniref:Glucans biosynthesis protein G n=1 Tax=Methylobacterium gnaphalii TaxID=1010610 RepID=A0A512JIB2_9HYPH|nr:glucan biosynthesis protein [Methylobacterium gnaphalii]GEP09699.1 glucans biosynthesis protein G [Methylobacterium gnaphalii]GJD67716.1 Glucans biosynthesis protein G [Methylobacterium gnaphalii]GLS50117.1 glucans biosynthesis protein G [Methylobacterium gnaphalii]